VVFLWVDRVKYVPKGNGAPRGGEFVSGEEIVMEKCIMRGMK